MNEQHYDLTMQFSLIYTNNKYIIDNLTQKVSFMHTRLLYFTGNFLFYFLLTRGIIFSLKNIN